MVIPLTWWIGHDNLHAAVRGIVCSLSFFPIVVANAVRVSFVKLKQQKNIFSYTISSHYSVYSANRNIGLESKSSRPTQI